MIIIIISILLIMLVANEIYFRFALSHTQEQQIYFGRKGNYDIVAFGSTYCRYGIDFPPEVNGFNFGFGGQFFYYTDKMLREIVPQCLNSGGTVLIIVADLVFAKVGKGLYGPERYPLFLSKGSLGDEFSIYKFAKMRFPLLFHPVLILSLLKYILKVVLKKDASEFETLTQNPLTKEQVSYEARKRCNSWCKQFGLKDTFSADLSDKLKETFVETTKILQGMIDFCLDNGYKPILIVTPVSDIMNNQLGEDFLNSVLFDNIIKSNTRNVPFLNYIHDKDFSDYLLYYKNADFLNVRGRRQFTKKLLKDIEKI